MDSPDNTTEVRRSPLPGGLAHGMADTSLGPLHYVRAGSGRPLVLIHGGFGSWKRCLSLSSHRAARVSAHVWP